MNLQIAQEENAILKEVIIQEGKEKYMVQQKMGEIEKKIDIVFKSISDITESKEASSEEKMRKIA
jgi:hypothetical protein